MNTNGISKYDEDSQESFQDYKESVKDITKFSQAPVNGANPFRHNLAEIIKVESRIKYAQNNIGSANLVDPKTGEIISKTGENRIFTSREHVDHNRFVKIYTERIKAMFNLSHSAIKVFGYFLNVMQMPENRDKDIIYFCLNDCMEYCDYDTHPMVYRGLTELIANCFIAKAEKPPNHYWIDPKTAFNGNRVIVLQEYIKDENKELGGDLYDDLDN